MRLAFTAGAKPLPSVRPKAVALFAVLLAAYAATLALPGRGTHDRSARETRYLMVAVSIQRDGDLGVADEYAARSYREFHVGTLRPPSEPHLGRLLEPVDLGLPLLAAPLLELGGVTAVSLLCAVAMALAMTLGAAMARRIVPEPWATGAALAVGLSPPALGAATAIGPEPLGAALLAGAALCALRVRDAAPHPPLRLALACAFQLALLPWLSSELIVAGLVVTAALVRWMVRRGRGLQAIVATEAVVFSAIAYVSVNERLFGGIVPKVVAAGPVTGADGVADNAARITRLVTLWADPAIGLLAWAPVLGLGFLGLWLLWRSRRERLALAVPGQRDVEVAATLCALLCGAQLLVAAFFARSQDGPWFPGLHLVATLPAAAALCAWGLRRAPRAGVALAALSVALSIRFVVAVATDASGLAPPDVPAWLGVAAVACSVAAIAALVAAQER
jgi:hypothetical protein